MLCPLEENLRQGLLVAGLLAAGPLLAQDTYGGPAVLSRGPVGRLAESSDLVVLRPSLQLLGSYESGLYLLGTDAAGRPVTGQSYGATALADVGGYHRWRHTVLGLNYRGSFRHYTGNHYLDGIDQNLALNVQHQAGARTLISVTGVGGTYSRGYGIWSGAGTILNYGDYSQGVDPTVALISGPDLLDTRTYYAAGGGDVIHQISNRLSMRAGGTSFAVRRRSRGLVELNGYNARGDATYRLGRRTNLSAEYQYIDFRFVRSFGSSFAHVAALNYAWQLNRNWTLALRGGGYRIESLRVERVELDPAVAAILGQTAGVEAMFRVNFGSMLGAAISRNFRRAGLTLRYDRGLTPGNALFLTTRADSFSASYSYRGWRRWALSLSATGSRHSTILQSYGTYRLYSAGASMSYRVGRYLHLVATGAHRYYDLSGARGGPARNSHLVSVGLGFSPGDLPISLR